MNADEVAAVLDMIKLEEEYREDLGNSADSYRVKLAELEEDLRRVDTKIRLLKAMLEDPK